MIVVIVDIIKSALGLSALARQEYEDSVVFAAHEFSTPSSLLKVVEVLNPVGVLGRSQRVPKYKPSKITVLEFLVPTRRYVKFSRYLSFSVLKPVRFQLDSVGFFIARNFWSK
jgi:hypothetical protein